MMEKSREEMEKECAEANAREEQYQQYKHLRQEIIDYQTMKQSVGRILGLEPAEQEQQKENSHTKLAREFS